MRLSLVCILLVCAGTASFAGVQAARYGEPTKRYDHAVLGDAIEFGSLEITTEAGKTVTLRLPDTRVFEDVAPRLVDVDLDGDAEIVVVETSIALGARLAIYDETGLVAATPYIGRTRRWLAPVGAADFDQDGAVELAYIDRPHLAKVLRVWRFKDGSLEHVVDTPGLTNHRIGEPVISGGLRVCGDGAEMITANADWSKIMSSTLANGRISTRAFGPFKGYESMQKALSCN